MLASRKWDRERKEGQGLYDRREKGKGKGGGVPPPLSPSLLSLRPLSLFPFSVPFRERSIYRAHSCLSHFGNAASIAPTFFVPFMGTQHLSRPFVSVPFWERSIYRARSCLSRFGNAASIAPFFFCPVLGTQHLSRPFVSVPFCDILSLFGTGMSDNEV